MVSANFLFTPHSARTGTVFSQYSAAVVRHRHWRRQLWGTGARASPLDFQLVILGISRFTDSESLASHAHGFLSSRAFSGHRFCRLSKATRFLRNLNQCLAHFVIFLAHSFPQGVIIVPKMPERSPINFNSTCTSDSGKTGS